MQLLVTGATSQLGLALRRQLAGQGVDLLALSRKPMPPQPAVQWLEGTLPEGLPAHVDVDGIVSFGPMQGLAAWLSHRRDAPAPCLVAVSSMSAVTKVDARVAADRATATHLLAGEQALQRECERLAMRWCILRPTMIYGMGLDLNLTPIARRACRWRVFAYPRAHALRQPVHAEDVAAAAWAALHRPEAHRQTIQCGGGERLSITHMFQRVRASLPVATLPLPIPMQAAVTLAPAVPALQGPLSRLGTDLIADNTSLHATLGILPRVFAPQARTWQLPA